MCGIIGYIGFQNPKGILLDGLKRLEYRGYDSAGIAVLERDGVEVFRSEGRLANLEAKLTDRNFEGAVGIGHTRWATHGAPTEINAHPHRVGSITLAHNGIIENYMKHKERLLSLGRKMASDTDSEIVAHLFDIEVQSGKSLQQAVTEVVPTLKGSFAFVVLSDKEPDLLIGLRNGPPLLAGVGDNESFLASDVQALLSRTNRIVYLSDGQFAVCRRDGVEVFDLSGKKVKPEINQINWTADQADKSGYRHYMLKEIHEQSQALTNTITGNIDHSRGTVFINELEPMRQELKRIRRLCLVACGSARHAALVGKDYIERFARIPVDVDFGSEFRYRDSILSDDTLLLLISQSGETADTLAAVREGKARKMPVLSICNVRDSTLARESDLVLYTNAGPEIGVATTKAFTTQLAMLYMLAVELGNLHGTLSEERGRELTQDLLQLPILVDKTLQMEKQVEALSAEQGQTTFYFYMGRGINYPIALEGALKLKEISYLHAEGYPAGELKHGPIALIDRQATVIVLAPQDRPSGSAGTHRENQLSETLYEKLMSNLQEVKSRGGKILCLGTEEDAVVAREAKHFLGVPRTTWALNPILLSIPVQLLAYYIALDRGTDVDKPRNLAKSVTVE